jgi:zinc transport system ATP-binding protein
MQVNELSGGQQQRVFVAQTLASDPDLLILDEPSTALDQQSRDAFFTFLQKLNRDRGVTIILISHDISRVGQYASQLLYLDKKIVFYGDFAEFCTSQEMNTRFGHFFQHLVCHQRHPDTYGNP